MPAIEELLEAAGELLSSDMPSPNEWHYLASSNVVAMMYTRNSSSLIVDFAAGRSFGGGSGTGNTLVIRFKGNRDYEYRDVPDAVVRDLYSAGSPGEYVNSDIKGRFKYSRA